jgi:hypothetical protein
VHTCLVLVFLSTKKSFLLHPSKLLLPIEEEDENETSDEEQKKKTMAGGVMGWRLLSDHPMMLLHYLL